jgi:hypothetical protein
VIGTIQLRGSGPIRSMWMPAGTIKTNTDPVCAVIRGMPFEPCFTLTRTGERSFRGAVYGMSFAYCDFTSRNVVASAGPRPAPRSSPVDAAATLRGGTDQQGQKSGD